MEQDIEILERMLKIEKECLHYDVSQDEIRAIEHLIKAYKELEEKLYETLNANLALVQGNANSIPVSLVEEKIEELKRCGNDWIIQREIQVLEKLLERRK